MAVVSVAGEEAAALLATRRGRSKGRRRRGTGEAEEDRGTGGEGGVGREVGDDEGEEGSLSAVDFGDESQVSALREAGFEGAGPLQLRLLVEVEIVVPEGGENSIELTVGGGGAAASVSSPQPLRLAAALPRRYLISPSLAFSSAAAEEEREGEEEEGEERIPSVAVFDRRKVRAARGEAQVASRGGRRGRGRGGAGRGEGRGRGSVRARLRVRERGLGSGGVERERGRG